MFSSIILKRPRIGWWLNPGWQTGKHPSLDVNCERTLASTIEYDPRVEEDLRALDKSIQNEILNYMETRIAPSGDPMSFGKALHHSQKSL